MFDVIIRGGQVIDGTGGAAQRADVGISEGRIAAVEPAIDATRSAHLAKAYCSDAFMKVAADNAQIQGGIGFTWEFAAQLYYKRAKSTEIVLGSPAYHRQKLAQCIGL